MDIKSTQTITVDIRKQDKSASVVFIQSDNNIVLINVLDNGSVADLSNVGSILVNIQRPDGEIFTQGLEWEGNVVTYKIGAAAMEVSGICEAELQFFDKTELTQKISTRKFKINLISAIGIGVSDLDESNAEVALLQQLIQDVSDAKKDAIIDGGSFLDTYSNLTTNTDGGEF